MNEVLQADLDDDIFLLYPTPNIKTNDVAYMVINRSGLSTILISQVDSRANPAAVTNISLQHTITMSILL